MTADTSDTFEIRVLLLLYLADNPESTGAQCTVGICGTPEEMGKEYYDTLRRQVYYQLKWLMKNGYVTSSIGSTLYYSITTLGRELLA